MLLAVVSFLLVGSLAVGYLSSVGASVSEAGLFGLGGGPTSNAKVTLQVTVNHQEQKSVDLLWLIQMAFRGQFWRPSCLVFCNNGVTYYLDPTVLITNYGRDFEQCKVYGVAGTITCTAADTATVIGVSASATAPATSDTYSSGPCSSANIITSNGFAPVAGTVTAGAAGSSVATGIKNQFTATGTESSVQTACLLTELTSGSNVIVYAEGTFGPDSLVSGNSITISWTVTRT